MTAPSGKNLTGPELPDGAGARARTADDVTLAPRNRLESYIGKLGQPPAGPNSHPHPDMMRPDIPGTPQTGLSARTQQSFQEAARPTRARIGEWVGDYLSAADMPAFTVAPAVWHNFSGRRPDGIEGAILRFDAGRTAPPDGQMRDHWGALNTLAWNQKQGLCSIVVARDGSIFLPVNFSWEKWGWHAGDSICPQTGRSDLSVSCIGIEINGAGQLYPTPDPDCFVPWFNAMRDPHGQIHFNAYGEARLLDPADEFYRRADVAMVAHRQPCIDAGVYAPMTTAQHQALISLLLWLQRTFPASFRMSRIYSAYEVARTRTADEGAGVGFFQADGTTLKHQTMAEFRADLQARWSTQQARMAYSYFHANRFAR